MLVEEIAKKLERAHLTAVITIAWTKEFAGGVTVAFYVYRNEFVPEQCRIAYFNAQNQCQFDSIVGHL